MREYLYRLATDKEKGLVAGVIKFFLVILSFVYGLFIRVLIIFKQLVPVRLSCKVISVGNITLGGTGKTVLVEYIASYLKEKGHKVAILTRGYKKRVTRSSGHQVTNYEEMGDEAYMLAGKLGDIPIIVDADRIRGAERAIKNSAVDTVILDDGFQQWHISKDLEVVAIDARNPFGNKKMIPRGILREPLVNLSRADVFMLTKTNLNPDPGALKASLRSFNPAASIFESMHEFVSLLPLNQPQEIMHIAALRGKSVVLFCGIGDPDSFVSLVSSLGIDVSTFFKFPDHHNYSAKDIDNIAQAAKEKNADFIITTEKDMVRVSGLCSKPYGARFLFLRIKLKIINEQEFHNRLLGLFSH